jgi:hypothetical protein
MGRVIDWSEPLSEEDRDWALQRGMDLQVAANDAAHEVTSDDVNTHPSVQMTGLQGTEPSALSDRVETHGIGEAQLAVNRDRAAALEAAEGGGVEHDDDYDTFTGPQLKLEIEKRNDANRLDAGDDGYIPVTGNKPDLIARLRADDKVPAAE